VTALVMTDVIAVEIANQGPSEEQVRMFEDLLTNPLVIGLNVVASLHLIANLGGQLWLDSITWVVLAAAYALVIPELTRPRWARGGIEQPDPVASN